MKTINQISKIKYSSEELLFLLLDLLNITTPFGNEGLIERFLPFGGYFDEVGNYIIELGDSQSLFCCHMDTVGQEVENVNPLYNNGYISSKTTKSCLGGDDRCVMLCCLAMINAEVPGTYIFHVGEERVAIGADYIIANFDLSKFKRAIEFDRRGTTSVITQMMMSPVCSDEFALDLCDKLGLNFVPDNTGIFTDVYKYKDLIPEVTNLSVGYYKEHSNKEKINADWLIYEFIPALLNVDWENLITERDPLKEEEEFNSLLFSSEEAFNTNHFDDSRINMEEFYFGKDKELGEDAFDFFIRGACKVKNKTCAFCEKIDEGDLKEIHLDGDIRYLCFDCDNYLEFESSFYNMPKQNKFKLLTPEFENFSKLD